MPSNVMASSRKAYASASSSSKAKKLAAARSRPTGARALAPSMKKAVEKIANKSAARAVDKAIPDTVITVQKSFNSNSAIGSADTGYFWKKANDCPITGGLSLVQRLTLIQEQPSGVLASLVVGKGVKCKSLYYYGNFHISPALFQNNIDVQNFGCNVHCFILSDKFKPLGVDRDENCVNDLLLDTAKLFPNNGANPYDGAAIQTQMIPFSGTQYDENLPINRNRFKVHHHKVWKIRPTSAVNTAVDVDPFCNATGNLHRTFRFKIPTPKVLKWDRRDLDIGSSAAIAQTPSNCGDPFVCWGYTPLPNAPDILTTNLVVNGWTTVRVEVLPNSAA